MSNTRSTRPVSQRPGRPARPHMAPRQQGKPFDLNAIEADGIETPFRFDFGPEGEPQFTLANPLDQDSEATEAAMWSASDSFRLLMSEADYARFMSHHPTNRQMKALASAMNDYYGLGEGLA